MFTVNDTKYCTYTIKWTGMATPRGLYSDMCLTRDSVPL